MCEIPLRPRVVNFVQPRESAIKAASVNDSLFPKLFRDEKLNRKELSIRDVKDEQH